MFTVAICLMVVMRIGRPEHRLVNEKVSPSSPSRRSEQRNIPNNFVNGEFITDQNQLLLALFVEYPSSYSNLRG